MKMAQQIPATIDTTIGMNGLASLFVIATHFIVQAYIPFRSSTARAKKNTNAFKTSIKV
jgi:hypothetical protein